MLEKFRNKFKSIFSGDSEEDDYEENSNQPLKPVGQVDAKVIYQYPKNASYNISEPSEIKTKNEDNNKKNNEKNKEDNERRKRFASIKNESKYSFDSKEEDSIEQREKDKEEDYDEYKRFKPTQVPSPIYGYHKRDKDESVDEKPAFMRKKKKFNESKEIKTKDPVYSNDIDEIQEIPSFVRKERENKPNDQKISPSFPTNERFKDLLDDKKSNDLDAVGTAEIAQTKEITVEPIEIIDAPKNSKESETIEEIEIEEDLKEEIVHTKINKKEQKSEDKPKDSSPFNVIMTPRDRKYLLDKKKNEREEAVKKSLVLEPKKSYKIPYHLLNDPVESSNEDQIWVKEQQELLERTLMHFNVEAKVVNATQGPSVTRFEVQPEFGVKVSKVRNLSDDIKLNMSAKDIRIEAPIPGKNTIGIEIPNLKSQMVGLQEIFQSDAFQTAQSPLAIGLGLDVEGQALVTNISKMPHGLIAGATGSGKSVCINTILISLMYKSSYKDVKFLLIDPKMVELAAYNGIPHLVSPVITDVKAATAALKWAVEEMENRYELFVREGARDIERYNEKMVKQERSDEKLPFMVIVIDELADLMMMSPHDVEEAICRIAQKARASGIHLLLATQRPSVDVITGLIKANIPTRIAFSVSSQVDSRTIIDTNGADRLLGNGDMLFIENGSRKSIRLQGAFVSDDEIERVTHYARTLAEPEYLFEQDDLLIQIEADEEDVIFDEVLDFILKQGSASTSLLQRQFRIGYNRAARLIDSLEMRGIISEQNGSKPRDVLLSKSQVEEAL